MKKTVCCIGLIFIILCMAACGKKEQTAGINKTEKNNYFELTVAEAVYNAEKGLMTVRVKFENKTTLRLTMTYDDKDDKNCGIIAKPGKTWEGEIVVKARSNNAVTKSSFFVNVNPDTALDFVEIASYDLVFEDGKCQTSFKLNEEAAKKAIEKYTVETE